MRLDDPPSVRLKVFVGLLIGTAVSAVVWIGFWSRLNVWLIVGLVVVKIIAALACTRVPGWRPVAQGLLVSMGTGLLIFFGKCAMSLNGFNG